jgi:ABC-2 type transport system ATP-binding protein
MNSVIRVEDVKKDYYVGLKVTKVEALKGVSFQIPEGSVTCFLGPNGSGKSTFIKIATDLVRPTSGKVHFFDNLTYNQARSRIGFVPEKPTFPGFLTPLELLGFVGAISKNFKKDKIEDTLKSVDLHYAKDRPCGGFSKGMNQRLALAQALLSEPDLLVLDEPFNGLDPDSRLNSVEILKSYAKQGKSIFLTSHLLEDVQKVCDYLVVIKEGRVLYKGDVQSLLKTTTFSLEYKSSSTGEILSMKVQESELESTLKTLLDQKHKLWNLRPDNQELTDIYKMLLEGKNVRSGS